MVTEMLSLLSKRISLFLCGNHVKTANQYYIYSFFMIIAVEWNYYFLLASVEAEHKKLDEIEYVVY
jgi:hypothetical protein